MIKIWKCLKYKKTEMETLYISKIYKYINIFKEKSNFVVNFTSMFRCVRRLGSLFLLNRIISFLSSQRIPAGLSWVKRKICLFVRDTKATRVML